MSLCYSEEAANADLCKMEEVHEKLIYKILMGIDNEITMLLDISTRFKNVNQVIF